MDEQALLLRRSIIRGGSPDRTTFAMRWLLWAVFVVCAILVVATVTEALARNSAEQRVNAARAHNAALQHDVTASQQAIILAQSDDEIERQARLWGYVRAGDQPVLIVQPANR